MLGKFLRREKRRSHEYIINKRDRKRPKIKSFTMESITPKSEAALSSRLVPVKGVVVEAMRIETLSLLHNQNPCSLSALAAALASSDNVMKCHSLDHSIRAMTTFFSGLSLGGETKQDRNGSYFLKKALNRLEASVGSDERNISSWVDAKDGLAAVLEFVDETQKNTDETSDYDKYRERINKISLKQQIRALGASSFGRWKEIEHMRPPARLSPPELVVDDQTSQGVIAETDQILQDRISESYKQRKARIESKLGKDVLDRLYLQEDEREEEAEKLASSLLRPLTESESRIVHEAMYGKGPTDEILAQVGTDSVRRASLHRLQPGQWLNDEVIHYFYVMLSNRDEELSRQGGDRKRSFFFKSFFITKLLNEGNANSALDGTYEYRNVKRWSKNVPGKDIFQLDKIFFPINQGRTHWICAVIYMEEKRIQMYDSMGTSGMYYLESLFQYLKDEHKDKKGSPLPDEEEWKLVPCTPDTPHQQNGYDCGVFTCMFADFLSQDCPLVFSQEHITQCRERIALSIMQGSAIL